MPIAYREMLLLAKSPVAFRSRLVTGLVMLVVGIAFAIAYSRAGSRSALPLLGIAGYSLSMMCMFIGAQLTADAIAKEKREGTLGLLFLTGLPSWQITMGKLIANGLAAFYQIFLLFPLLSLLLITGGVLPGEILQMSLAFLNTLFVTACIGLLISAVSLDQKRAAGGAIGMVMLFWTGLPLLAQINSRLGGAPWLSEGLLLFSLNSSLIPSRAGMGMGVTARNPWLNLVCTHALGWFFLALTTLILPHCWQDKPEAKKISFKQCWKRLSFGSASVRRHLRAELLERNPFLWLALRDRLRLVGVWIFTLIMLAIAGWLYFVSKRDPAPLLAICLVTTVVHRFMAAGAGATQLMMEQEQGTIEMLLSTLVNPREILKGQFMAAVQQFRGPVLLVLLFHFVILLVLFSRPQPAIPAKVGVFVSVAFYLFDLYCAIWLSMWGAVITRQPKHAAGAAFGRLLGIPLFIVASATILIATLKMLFGFSFTLGPVLTIVSFCLLFILNNCYWLRRIHRELPSRLRTYAFRRYSPEDEKGFLGALGTKFGKLYGRLNFSRAGL